MVLAQAVADFYEVMPVTPQQFVTENVIEYIQPELITFVSAIAGAAVFKGLIFKGR